MPSLPLNALRAFEAAARHGGFVQAGKELRVSSAAVSQQVKNLEAYLNKQLFLRQGNRILLTDAVEVLYPDIAEALNQLADCTRSLQYGTSRNLLMISVLPALSELWLLPKLSHLQDWMDRAVEIRVENDPIDFSRSGIDLRLTYGNYFYNEYAAVELFRDVAVPACSPGFWANFGEDDPTLTSVPEKHLITTFLGASFGSEPTWSEWFDKKEPSRLRHDQASALRFNSTALAVAAAC